MQTKQVVVVETIRALPGKKSALRNALQQLLPISRKALGCLRYDLLENEGGTFLILMRWKTLADLRHHETSDYIEKFVQEYENILYDDVQVTEWTDV